MSYKFRLASNRLPKIICPKCLSKRHWQRYFNTETGEALDDKFGRCDNEAKCGYHVTPYLELSNEFTDTTNGQYKSRRERVIVNSTIEKTFIPHNLLNKLAGTREENRFYVNLQKNVKFPFSNEILDRVFDLYSIGTIVSGELGGATTFPFIDYNQRVHAIQVKTFDNMNHTIRTDFIHTLLARTYKSKQINPPLWLGKYLKNNSKVDCLFGEQLLEKYLNNPVALVEAPKTAIYGALYFGVPNNTTDLIWLATYNLSSLTLEKCKVLEGRNVILFPDLSKEGSTYQKWKSKSVELNSKIPKVKFIVSDFLENRASPEEKSKGLDLADFLIRLDWRDFLKAQIPNKTSITSLDRGRIISFNDYVSTLHFKSNMLMADGYPASWDLNATYIDSKTRALLGKMIENKHLLKLFKKADLVNIR